VKTAAAVARAQRLERAKMLSQRAKVQKVTHMQPRPKSPDLFGADPDIDMDELDSIIESTLINNNNTTSDADIDIDDECDSTAIEFESNTTSDADIDIGWSDSTMELRR
jgi:hypothetical protein